MIKLEDRPKLVQALVAAVMDEIESLNPPMLAIIGDKLDEMLASAGEAVDEVLGQAELEPTDYQDYFQDDDEIVGMGEGPPDEDNIVDLEEDDGA